LVIFAWSALACGFGPLVIVLALGGKPSETLALAMIATGLATALGWRELGYNAWLYEGLPGMVAGFAIYVMGSLILGPKVAQTLPSRQRESDDR
jgi:Na+/pantothenate symporter